MALPVARSGGRFKGNPPLLETKILQEMLPGIAAAKIIA
jgi:hypothetical protein